MASSRRDGAGPRRVRVVELYRREFEDPIAVRAGDRVTVGRRDQQFPAWRWVTTGDGRSGWMAERYLELRGDDDGVALRDYDATELSVEAGDELAVLDEEGGWLWCESARGERGWVPAEVTEGPARPP
jgi:hypothetical protein